MKIFLSYPLGQDTPTYGNRDNFLITTNSEIKNGVGANTSSWTFTNNHMGTHMDTPYHFVEQGKKTLDYTAEEFCFDEIFVVEKLCSKGDLITLAEEELNSIPSETSFLVIKTGYCEFRGAEKYHNDNPGLESSLADVLKARFPKLRAVGFDFLSLTSWNYREHGRLSHRSFLGEPNNFLVIEDMDLCKVSGDTKIKYLVLAPLRTVDGNGGPVTIIADINEK